MFITMIHHWCLICGPHGECGRGTTNDWRGARVLCNMCSRIHQLQMQCNFNIKFGFGFGFGLEIEMLLQRFSLYAICDMRYAHPTAIQCIFVVATHFFPFHILSLTLYTLEFGVQIVTHNALQHSGTVNRIRFSATN